MQIKHSIKFGTFHAFDLLNPALIYATLWFWVSDSGNANPGSAIVCFIISQMSIRVNAKHTIISLLCCNISHCLWVWRDKRGCLALDICFLKSSHRGPCLALRSSKCSPNKHMQRKKNRLSVVFSQFTWVERKKPSHLLLCILCIFLYPFSFPLTCCLYTTPNERKITNESCSSWKPMRLNGDPVSPLNQRQTIMWNYHIYKNTTTKQVTFIKIKWSWA